MTDVDQMIRDAMSSEDREWFDQLGEPGPIDQVLESFRSRNRWLIMISIVFTFAMMGGAIYFGIGMFQAEAVRETVLWAMGLYFCIQAITALKIWFWMEMSRHGTARELKRLELQVARLASRGGEA